MENWGREERRERLLFTEERRKKFFEREEEEEETSHTKKKQREENPIMNEEEEEEDPYYSRRRTTIMRDDDDDDSTAAAAAAGTTNPPFPSSTSVGIGIGIGSARGMMNNDNENENDVETNNTFTNTNKITVDEAFDGYVGQIGRGQLKQFLLSSSAWLPAAFLTLVSVFTQRTPEWECLVGSDEEDYYYSYCSEQKAKASEDDLSVLCTLNDYYDKNKNGTTSSADGGENVVWKWTNEKQSIVSEFSLICKDEYKIQLASSMFFLGFFFGAGVLGQLSDARGRRTGVYAAVLISSLGAGLASISYSYSQYFVAVFIGGFGVGGIGVASFVLCTEPLGISWKGIMGIGTQYWWALGICSMSFFGYLMRESWRTYSFFCGVIGCGYVALTFSFLRESPRWLLANGKPNEAKEVLEFLAKKNGRLTFDRLPDLKEPERTESVNVSAIFPHKKLKLRLMCMAFVFACNGLIYYGISLNVGNLAGSIYLNNFLSGLVEIPSHIVAQFAVDIIGRRTTLMSMMSLSGFGAFISGFLKGKQRIFFALVGRFGISGSFNVVYLYTTELFPTIVRSAALGSCSMIGRIGSISAPQVLFLRVISPELPSIVLALFAFLAVLTCTLVPETHGLILEESLEGAELQACGEEVTQNLAIGSQFSNNFTQLIAEEEDDEYDEYEGSRMLGTMAVNSSSTMRT
jgi:OCT family organic cation transporter-like MFS transporter 4/5